MTRTMTIDVGEELHGFVESLVQSGRYKTHSDVIRDGLRLLQEQQAASQLEMLQQLIDEGINSGKPVSWDADEFLRRMNTPKPTRRHAQK